MRRDLSIQAPPTRQQGYTLVELALAVVLVGVIGTYLAAYLELGFTLRKGTENLRQQGINDRIAKAMEDWSTRFNNELPAPYSGGPDNRVLAPFTDAPATNADDDLLASMTSRGVLVGEINTDGTPARRVRVYQRVPNQTVTLPLWGRGGQTVTLTYDVGVIYLTQCFQEDVCHTAATTNDPPGDSEELTAANVDTWQTEGTDSGAVWMDTLPQQIEFFDETRGRLAALKNALRGYFNAEQAKDAVGSARNFWPFGDVDGDDDPDLEGSGPPGANQGCHDGWYDLTSVNSAAIFAQLGLNQDEYSITAFGGRIDMCRDYDPGGTLPEGTLPHNLALRLNKSLSDAVPPSLIDPTQNVYITM